MGKLVGVISAWRDRTSRFRDESYASTISKLRVAFSSYRLKRTARREMQVFAKVTSSSASMIVQSQVSMICINFSPKSESAINLLCSDSKHQPINARRDSRGDAKKKRMRDEG